MFLKYESCKPVNMLFYLAIFNYMYIYENAKGNNITGNHNLNRSMSRVTENPSNIEQVYIFDHLIFFPSIIS